MKPAQLMSIDAQLVASLQMSRDLHALIMNQWSIGSVEVRFFIGDPKKQFTKQSITSGAKILNFISASFSLVER